MRERWKNIERKGKERIECLKGEEERIQRRKNRKMTGRQRVKKKTGRKRMELLTWLKDRGEGMEEIEGDIGVNPGRMGIYPLPFLMGTYTPTHFLKKK